MKKQNKNYISALLESNIRRKLFLWSFLALLMSGIAVFAADIIIIINYQSATWYGSSSSVVTTSYGVSGDTYYVNKWDNSTAVWNYFQWFYHDSVLWFFELDWSTNPSENVRVVDSTSECTTGYWYKLGWYSYNPYYGFMDFDYSDSIFVYYCINDGSLHGYAYNKYIGFQNFEWITFNLFPTVSTAFENPSSSIFVNDVTDITDIESYTWSSSNKDYNTIWWEQYGLDDTQESTFYIIK